MVPLPVLDQVLEPARKQADQTALDQAPNNGMVLNAAPQFQLEPSPKHQAQFPKQQELEQVSDKEMALDAGQRVRTEPLLDGEDDDSNVAVHMHAKDRDCVRIPRNNQFLDRVDGTLDGVVRNSGGKVAVVAQDVSS